MGLRFAAVLLLCSASAGAVEVGGRARGALSAGVDTNPARDFVSPSAGQPQPDAVLQGIVNLFGGLEGERGLVNGSYDVGVRKFVLLGTEDTIVQTLQLDGQLWLGRGFGLGVTGRARDRRIVSREREYTDLSGEANLIYAPDAALDFRLWGGWHRFIFWSGFRESFYAPEGGLLARYRFTRRHSVVVTGQVSFRTFNADAYPNPDVDPPPDPTVRKDFFALVSAAYWYRGPVVVSLSYGYLDSSSNSFGEALRQHRVGLVFGAPLFWQVTLLIEVNLRFSQYPDGLYISPDILTLDEGGENLSTGVLKLVRPLGEHFEVEARYGFFYGQLPKNGFVYQRHVASLGLNVHF